MLVVAYAIAGTVGIDFEKEPLGRGGSVRSSLKLFVLRLKIIRGFGEFG